MKMVFFEVQNWEKELMQKYFPEAVLTDEKLSEESVDKYKDVEIACCFIYSNFSKELIDRLPKLKLIATRSTGFDHIDASYAKDKKITISNVPEYGSRTVAEYAFALMLNLSKKINQSINQTKNFDFDHKNIRGIDLFGKKLGVIGLGKIGIEVIKIAHGFEMKILVYTRRWDENLSKQLAFEYVNLEKLIKESDVVTLHLPYVKETHHIINKTNINYFKKGSYLVNTARGGLIETEALVMGLDRGILAGVALDVLEEEKELAEEIDILTSSYKAKIDLKTLILEHILINHPKAIITPHNAFNSQEALERIILTTIENIKGFIDNKPTNLV